MFRDEWGRLVASLVRLTGDLQTAEDAAQDAFAVALDKWGREGTPERPGAWLLTVARRRLIDSARRQQRLTSRLPLLVEDQAADPVATEQVIPDDRLELIFTCCHPSLAREAQIALTLRTLGGLSTEEIARAFLVHPETMKRRLTRARTKIRATGIPFRVPPADVLPERLDAVLTVIYLIFNSGFPDRSALAVEAVRLARVIAQLMPDDPEVRGLLSLLLFHDSRRDARVRDDVLVTLTDQDRDRWDTAALDEARAHLDHAWRAVPPRSFALQARIAFEHTAPTPDWTALAHLYAQLFELTGSPVVRLNWAVAVAETDSPEAALQMVDELGMDTYQYWHSTRADLLRRLGRTEEARAAYAAALDLCGSSPERRFLEQRMSDVSKPPGRSTP